MKYILVIDRCPIPHQREPTVNGIGVRQTQETHRRGHSLSASWEGSENTHPNSVASSTGFFPSFLYSWAVFHSNTPCSKQPCYNCFFDSQQFQMSVPPSTETKTRPRATKNMYLISYALFQIKKKREKKKKRLCQKKKTTFIKQILSVWLNSLFF